VTDQLGAAAAAPDAIPRRLHPGTMLVTGLRGLPSTVLGIPALIAVSGRTDFWIILAVAAAALLLGGMSRWLSWRRFTYAQAEDALVIESGVLSRNRRTIPYARVADVGIERPPLHRLFGLAKVTLETGSAGADEGALDSVTLAEAERLRALFRRQGVELAVPAERGPAPKPPVFAMSTRRVLLSGLFNFSLVWIAIAFGAIQSVSEAFDLEGAWARLVKAQIGDPRAVPVAVWVQAGAAALVLAILLGIVAGLIRTVLRDHGYRLTDEGGRLRRVRGLLTRSEAIIALPRVQLAVIDSGPVRRRLGWARLRAQVLGGDGAKGRQDLAPFARAGEVDALLTRLRLQRLSPDALTPVARGHILRAALRRTISPMVPVLVIAFFVPPILLAVPLLLPGIALALIDRRYHRYRVSQGALQVQRGVLGRKTWIVPIRRVQAVSVRRSWLQRRLGLATVMVDVAGGSPFDGPHVHDLHLPDALALLRALRG
jgi:putative membrane protein